jgi:hypothetical protein
MNNLNELLNKTLTTKQTFSIISFIGAFVFITAFAFYNTTAIQNAGVANVSNVSTLSTESSSFETPDTPSVVEISNEITNIQNDPELNLKIISNEIAPAKEGELSSTGTCYKDVKLAWNPNPETNISHYILSWGDSTRNYLQSKIVYHPTTQTTVNLRSSIGNPKTYYFAVKAVNVKGLMSAYSSEVSGHVLCPETQVSIVDIPPLSEVDTTFGQGLNKPITDPLLGISNDIEITKKCAATSLMEAQFSYDLVNWKWLKGVPVIVSSDGWSSFRLSDVARLLGRPKPSLFVRGFCHNKVAAASGNAYNFTPSTLASLENIYKAKDDLFNAIKKAGFVNAFANNTATINDSVKLIDNSIIGKYGDAKIDLSILGDVNNKNVNKLDLTYKCVKNVTLKDSQGKLLCNGKEVRNKTLKIPTQNIDLTKNYQLLIGEALNKNKKSETINFNLEVSDSVVGSVQTYSEEVVLNSYVEQSATTEETVDINSLNCDPFTSGPFTLYRLNITANGPGQVRRIIQQPGGNVSDKTGTSMLNAGVYETACVKLDALPDAGMKFTGWEGYLSGTTTPTLLAQSGMPSYDVILYANFAYETGPNLTTTILTTGGDEEEVGGSVTSYPSGIDCGEDCDENYDLNTSVELTASSSVGFEFVEWTGDASGTSTTATISMDGDKRVYAEFGKVPNAPSWKPIETISSEPDDYVSYYDLNIDTVARSVIPNPAILSTSVSAGEGSGTVEVNPSTDLYINNERVTITANPAAGSIISSWTGCDSVSGNVCTVTMNYDKNVHANFILGTTVSVGNYGNMTPDPDTNYLFDFGGNGDEMMLNINGDNILQTFITNNELVVIPMNSEWDCDNSGTNCFGPNGATITFENFDSSALTTIVKYNPGVITPKITVLSPNGGEVWPVGSTQTITWNTEGIFSPDDKITVYIMPDDGQFKNINIGQSIPNTGSYTWVVPDPVKYIARSSAYVIGGKYKIFVCAQKVGINNLCSNGIDYGDGAFTIVAQNSEIEQISTFRQKMDEMINALELYKAENGKYPYQDEYYYHLVQQNGSIENPVGKPSLFDESLLGKYMNSGPEPINKDLSSSAYSWQYYSNPTTYTFPNFLYRCKGDTTTPKYIIKVVQADPYKERLAVQDWRPLEFYNGTWKPAISSDVATNDTYKTCYSSNSGSAISSIKSNQGTYSYSESNFKNFLSLGRGISNPDAVLKKPMLSTLTSFKSAYEANLAAFSQTEETVLDNSFQSMHFSNKHVFDATFPGHATKFVVNQRTSIKSLEFFMMNDYYGAHKFTGVIYKDNQGNVDTTQQVFVGQKTYSTSVDNVYGWVLFDTAGLVLEPGTYWAAAELRTGDYFALDVFVYGGGNIYRPTTAPYIGAKKVNSIYQITNDAPIVRIIGFPEVNISYEVSYNGNTNTGGTVPASQTKTENVNLTLASNSGNLTKTGYTFAGWNTNTSGTGTNYAVGSTYTANASATMYAKWTQNTYAINISPIPTNGTIAKSPNQATYTHGTSVTLTATPAEGYRFASWTGCVSPTATCSITMDSAKTVSATFELIPPQTYTVTYNGNTNTGGTVPASQTKTENVNLTLASNSGNLTKTGYTFAGWNTNTSGTGTNYAVGSTYTANASATMYAKWTQNTYAINISPIPTNGTIAKSPNQATYTHGTSVTLTATPAEGYRFASWTGCVSPTATCSITMDSAKTVSATFELIPPQTYTVTYNGNTNTGGTVPASQTKTENVNLTLASNSGNLTKTGYTFAGWNTNTSGTGTNYAVGSTYTANASATMYAKWTQNTYAINISPIPTNGTIAKSPNQATYTHGTSVTLTATPAEGYRFASWTGCVSPTATCSITMDSAKTVSATFELIPPQTYTVTYNGNTNTGGTVPASQTKTENVNLTLASNSGNLTKTGYTFAGWNTNTSGTGTNYAVGSTYTANASATMYAKWTQNTYAINISPIPTNGTIAKSPNQATYTHGTSVTLTATPAEGYRFASWTGCVSPTATCSITMDSAKTVSATFELIPPQTYTVTYNGNTNTGGTVPASQTKTENVNLTLASNSGNLTKTGYTFAGWNTNTSGTGTNYAVGSTYTANASATMYAKWTQNTYAINISPIPTNGTIAKSPNQATYTHGTSVTLTATPAEGYRFASWTGCVSPTATCSITMDSAKTVSATFELIPPQTYTVTYNGNTNTGGTVPASQTKTENVNLTLASNSGNLTKTGYTFAGWNTNTSGTGTNYAVGSTYTANASATMYAKWTQNTYAINISPIPTNGTIAKSPNQATYTHGTSVTLTATPAEGYRFASWTGCVSPTATCSITMDSAKTVSATFELIPPQTYTVTYNGNTNTGGTVPASQTKTENVNLTLASNSGNLTKTGYTFAGWNTNTSGTGTNYAVGSTYTANASATMYAKWTQKYILTVNEEGTGTGTIEGNLTSYDEGDLAILTATPSSDSTFEGWTGCTSVSNNVCTVNMTSIK